MMKSFFTLAALAMVAIVACNKEIDAPEENNAQIDPKGDVTIIAEAPAETKTMVDGLDVKWASGDHIAVIDNNMIFHDFSLDSGAGTTTGVFSGSFGGQTSGGYAIYPFSANVDYDGDFYVDYPTSYAYNAVTVPLLGEEGSGDDAGKYTFSHIGGAFKISYYNVPSGTDSFVFTSTSDDVTGTAIFDGTDSTIPSGAKVVTVTDLPNSSALDFIIPVPAATSGTDYTFSVKLYNGGDIVPGSEKTVTSAKNVALGHVKPLKEIELPAANGTTLWFENWGTQSDANTKTLAQYNNSGKTVYRSKTVSYSASLDGTIIYTTKNTGALYVNPSNKSNELMLAKKAKAGDPSSTFTIANIPTGSATKAHLIFYTNNNTTTRYEVSSPTTGVSVGSISQTGTGAPYQCVFPITITEGVSQMTLVISNTTTDNVRLDDISVKVGDYVIPHSISYSPDGDILMGGNANDEATITVSSSYAWTASFSLGSGRGTDYDIYIGGEKVDGTVSGSAGNTAITFKAKNDGNGDGSTVSNYGTISFTDSVDGTTTTGAINVRQSAHGAKTPVAHTLNFTYSSHTGWTVSATVKSSSYYLLETGKYITSPSFSFDSIDSVEMNMRTYGGGSYKTVDIYYGESKIGSIDATNGSTFADASTDIASSPAAGTGTLRFSSSTTDTDKGPGVKTITIHYTVLE